jgi:hypothetical protein
MPTYILGFMIIGTLVMNLTSHINLHEKSKMHAIIFEL